MSQAAEAKSSIDDVGKGDLEDIKSLLKPKQYGRSGFFGILRCKYVFLCALFAAIGGLLFGYDQGVITVILVMPSFRSTFTKLNHGDGFYMGFMNALLQLGAAIGAFFSGYLADKYSRRYTISFAAAIFMLGSIIQAAASIYNILVIGRFLGGIGIGILSAVSPLYMSEISSPEIRGSLLALEEWNIVVGIVIAYWMTYGSRYIPLNWSWRFPFLIQVLPALVLGIGILFLPSSPRWLSMKERNDESLSTISKLRQRPSSDSRVIREWLEIRAETEFAKGIAKKRYPNCFKDGKVNEFKYYWTSFSDLFKGSGRRRITVGILLYFFQQFIGINALIYYAPLLFEKLGLSYNTNLIMSGITQVMQLIGCTPTILLLDNLGRRPLLLFGSFTCSATLLCVAVLVGCFSKDWVSHQAAAKAGVGLIFAYMVFFGLTWGPIPWAMPSEIFNISIRAKGVALSVSLNWLFNCFIGLISPIITVKAPDYAAFAFFTVFSMLSIIFVYFLIPETRNRTLEEMDAVFKDKSSQEDERQKIAIFQSFYEQHVSSIKSIQPKILY